MLILRSAFGAILGFVFWIVATRSYSSEDIGFANALFSAVGLLNIISTFGLHMGLIRFLPSAEDKKSMVNSCLTITGVVSLVLAVVFIIGLPIWSPKLLELQHDKWFILAFILLTPGFSLLAMLKYGLLAQRYAGWTLVLDMIWKASNIIVLFALIGLGALGIFSSWLTIYMVLIMGIYVFARLNPGYQPVPGFNGKVIKPMARFSFDSYLAEGLMNAPVYLLPLIIINMLGPEVNAYFSIALTFAGILFMIPKGTFVSLFVEGSHNSGNLRPNIIKSTIFVFILLIISIIAIFALGDKILLIFGKEYSIESLYALKLISLSSIFIAVNELYIGIRRVQTRTKPIIFVYLFTAVFTIIFCTWFGYARGLPGVALGWIISQGLVAIGTGIALVKEIWYRTVKS
jgi:O-antigen/teichoic acid export membrane protein